MHAVCLSLDTLIKCVFSNTVYVIHYAHVMRLRREIQFFLKEYKDRIALNTITNLHAFSSIKETEYTSLTLSLILLLLLYLLSVFSTIGAGKYNFSLNYTCIAFVIIIPFTYQFVYQNLSLSSSPKTFSSLQLAVRKIRIANCQLK